MPVSLNVKWLLSGFKERGLCEEALALCLGGGWGGGKCPTTVPAIIFRLEASLLLAGRWCLTPSEGDFALGPALGPSQLLPCCSQVAGDASRL